MMGKIHIRTIDKLKIIATIKTPHGATNVTSYNKSHSLPTHTHGKHDEQSVTTVLQSPKHVNQRFCLKKKPEYYKF